MPAAASLKHWVHWKSLTYSHTFIFKTNSLNGWEMWNPESDWAWHWDLNLRHGVPALSCFPGPESIWGSSLHGLKLGLWEETPQRRQLEVKLWVINMFIHHLRTVPQRIQVSFHCVFNSGMLLLSCQQILVREWVGRYREGFTASAQCSWCDWLRWYLMIPR